MYVGDEEGSLEGPVVGKFVGIIVGDFERVGKYEGSSD